MTLLTHTLSPVRNRPLTGESAFGAFALILSFALVMLGLFMTAYPQPDAATGDPFLFVMRP